MSDNDRLIRFEWSDFLVSFLYYTWSLTNTVFECISLLSFTFYFRSFLFFLCYDKFEKTNFLTNIIFLLRQLTTAIATRRRRCHQAAAVMLSRCRHRRCRRRVTAASCKPTDNHHTMRHCRFLLPLTSLLLLIPGLQLISFLPPTLLLQRCCRRWLLRRCQHPTSPLQCMLTPYPPPPTRTRRGKCHSQESTPRKVVGAKTSTPPPLPSPTLNSGGSNIV